MQKLIGLGATDIVVPGVLPIGCFPIYLTIYQSSNSSDYDDLGCLSSFNDLSTYHNTLLQKRVGIIQSRHRKTARIMYRRLLLRRLRRGPEPTDLRYVRTIDRVVPL